MLSAANEYFAPVMREWKASARKWRGKKEPIMSSKITYGNNYYWVPKNIRLHIENTMEKTYTWNEEIGGRKITISIACPSSISSDTAATACTKICRWLDVASKFARGAGECSPKINIYIYFTNARKMLPARRGAPIDTENVNTAFTTSCVRGRDRPGEIHLFRQEEWFKVFIHETFHLLGLDFASGGAADAAEHLGRAILGSQTTHDCQWLIFETYTEFMAEILALMFTRGWILRERDIKREQLFSAGQTNKLLEHMDLKYEELWPRPGGGGGIIQHKRVWLEKTPVFCYYVLKMILWVHMPEFLKWCRKNNTNVLKCGDNAPIEFARFLKNYSDSYEVERALSEGRSNGQKDLKMMFTEI